LTQSFVLANSEALELPSVKDFIKGHPPPLSCTKVLSSKLPSKAVPVPQQELARASCGTCKARPYASTGCSDQHQHCEATLGVPCATRACHAQGSTRGVCATHLHKLVHRQQGAHGQQQVVDELVGGLCVQQRAHHLRGRQAIVFAVTRYSWSGTGVRHRRWSWACSHPTACMPPVPQAGGHTTQSCWFVTLNDASSTQI